MRWLAAMCVVLTLPLKGQQSERQWIRGTVSSEDSVPLRGATVSLLDLRGAPLAQVLVDSTGSFRIPHDGDAPVLLLQARLLGFAPRTDTLVVARGDHLRVRRLILRESSVTLASVNVVESRPRPPRALVNDPTPRSSRRLDRSSLLLADPTGDLVESLAQAPGLTIVDAGDGKRGISAFGMGADQNASTLNGVESGVVLPRDGLAQTVRLSTYDPRNGRFGGIQISSNLPSGSPIASRNLRITGSPPGLSTSSNGSLPLASQPLVMSGTASGSLGGTDSSIAPRYYNVAAQIQRMRVPTRLFGAAAPGAPDLSVVQQVRDEAAQLGVPTTTDTPLPGADDAASAIARIDLTPFGSGAVGELGPVVYVLAAGSMRRSAAAGLTPWATPSRASRTEGYDTQLSFSYSPYVADVLSETRVSVLKSDDETRPLKPYAAALLRLPDVFSNGLRVETGGAGRRSSRHTTGAQLTSDLQWMSRNGGHRFNVYMDYLGRRATQRSARNPLGTWEFDSFDAFSRNEPARYTIEPFVRTSDVSLHQAALAVSDVIYLSNAARLDPSAEGNGATLQLGLRLDADRLTGNLNNQRVALPGRVELQPMVGVTWRGGSLVQASQDGRLADSRHSLTAGVRRYAGAPSLTAMDVIQVVGMGQGQVECLGRAAPPARWSALAQGELAPTSCLPTVQPSNASTLPSQRRYGENFVWPESWRGEIQWRSAVNTRLDVHAGMTHARNGRAGSFVDENLVTSPAFFTNLDRRPVYASASSIDTLSGFVPLVESRRDSNIGRDDVLRSDLRSRSTILQGGMTLRSTPPMMRGDVRTPGFSGQISAWYTWQDSRSTLRGFTATTAGDPRALDDHVRIQPTHTVQLVLDATRRDWFTASFSLRVTSGVPFTPIVGGDVNGDGLSNDRTFLASDGTVGQLIDSLLPGLNARSRRCLETQRGRMAAPNSCRGGVGLSLGTLALSLDPFRLGFGRRGTVRLTIQNALGGLDQILHGSRGRRGWGDRMFTDPVLLLPVGFDRAANNFRYRANPSFGSAGAVGALLRPPSSLMLDAHFELGEHAESQYLRMRSRTTEGSGGARDSATFEWVWAEAERSPLWQWTTRRGALDSLQLEPETRAAIDSIVGAVTVRRTCAYRELAHHLAERGTNAVDRNTRARWHNTIVEVARLTLRANRDVLKRLSEDERKRLSYTGLATSFRLDERWLARIRRDWLIRPL